MELTADEFNCNFEVCI